MIERPLWLQRILSSWNLAPIVWLSGVRRVGKSTLARDIQELFRVEKRGAFLKLVESVLRLSGGQIEATTLANLTGLSRPTVLSYLDVLEATHVTRTLRPWSGGGTRELVKQPRIYGFDTGFVAFARGWSDLRPDDLGNLWEHLVLERLGSDPAAPDVHYWRDKDDHEIDFIIPRGRGVVDAIECKWNSRHFDPDNLRRFRSLHPKGANFIVSTDISKPLDRSLADLAVTFTGLDTLAAKIWPMDE